MKTCIIDAQDAEKQLLFPSADEGLKHFCISYTVRFVIKGTVKKYVLPVSHLISLLNSFFLLFGTSKVLITK